MAKKYKRREDPSPHAYKPLQAPCCLYKGPDFLTRLSSAASPLVLNHHRPQPQPSKLPPDLGRCRVPHTEHCHAFVGTPDWRGAALCHLFSPLSDEVLKIYNSVTCPVWSRKVDKSQQRAPYTSATFRERPHVWMTASYEFFDIKLGNPLQLNQGEDWGSQPPLPCSRERFPHKLAKKDRFSGTALFQWWVQWYPEK